MVRWVSAGVAVMAVLVVGVVALTMGGPDPVGEAPSTDSPVVETQQPPAPRVDLSPPPTDGDPAPVVDPLMDEAKVAAFLRIEGDAGATHRRVQDVVERLETPAATHLFIHAAVQDYLDKVATYRDQVAAGEMQERDLVFNDEEALEWLDDSLRQRLQADADAIVEVL